MKKTILLALIICLLLAACSSPKFKMSEQHQKYGLQALEIADAYIDLKISLDDAYQRLVTLSDAVDSLPEEKGTDNATGNLLLSSKVSRLESAFWSARVKASGIASSISSDIVGVRDDLADLLGKSKR